MVYRQRRGDVTTEYSWRQNWLGGKRVKVFSLTIDGIDMGDGTLIQSDSAITFATTKPLTMLESPRIVPEFRQVWVDESVARGEGWDDPDTGTRTVMAGFESVTVPAGTFEHCYRTVTEASPELFDSLTSRRNDGSLTVQDYQLQIEQARLVVSRWFAPGVGLVKEQIGGPDYVRELVKVKHPGRGELIPPDPDPVPDISR